MYINFLTPAKLEMTELEAEEGNFSFQTVFSSNKHCGMGAYAVMGTAVLTMHILCSKRPKLDMLCRT